MSENPYQSPGADTGAVGINSGSREDLRVVAQSQRVILLCILIYLVFIAVQFALPQELRPILGLLMLGLGIVSTVFVFRLAMKVYSSGLGIVMGILTLIPCLGLVSLLVVNGKATTVLRSNGIKVGLLGANMSQL